MTQPIDPTSSVRTERRSGERRSRDRRQGDRRTAAGSKTLPVPVAAARTEPGPEPQPPRESAAFSAQLLGQPGQKRGLKGGPPVLDAARAAYLGAEWSGPADRRKPTGRTTKTEL